jgi:hypothetical protein
MVWNQATDNMNALMTGDTKKTNVERTVVLHDTEIIINTYLHILHKANRRWDYFADVQSLSVVPLGFEAIRKAILEARAKGTRLRFITEITQENISYVRVYRKCRTQAFRWSQGKLWSK